MSVHSATIHTDGASRGNPGAAAWSFVFHRAGSEPVERAERMGTTTNNVAEYTALVKALEFALESKAEQIDLFSDSELMVKQINGEYSVKNAELKELYDYARGLIARIGRVHVHHVRRAENKRADELCNAVLDGRPPASSEKPKKKAKATAAARNPSVDEEAKACLAAAAQKWSRDGAESLSAAQVWDQIWSVLEEGGVLKKARKT